MEQKLQNNKQIIEFSFFWCLCLGIRKFLLLRTWNVLRFCFCFEFSVVGRFVRATRYLLHRFFYFFFFRSKSKKERLLDRKQSTQSSSMPRESVIYILILLIFIHYLFIVTEKWASSTLLSSEMGRQKNESFEWSNLLIVLCVFVALKTRKIYVCANLWFISNAAWVQLYSEISEIRKKTTKTHCVGANDYFFLCLNHGILILLNHSNLISFVNFNNTKIIYDHRCKNHFRFLLNLFFKW